MTISERMKRAGETLMESRARMCRTFEAIEQAYAQLHANSQAFKAAMDGLESKVGAIGTSLHDYQGQLDTLHDGVGALGGKSRELSGIMDRFLTGSTARQLRSAA